MNEVLQGDCLEILAELPGGCVDLIYADPPFATGKDWGQFDDRWEGGLDGYLDYMRPRLDACRRVLAETGSFWLHCDPTASHYLKVMCDDLFGREQFRNEVVWCYTGPTNAKTHFPRKHDVILFYAQPEAGFNPDAVRVPYSPVSVAKIGETRPDKWYNGQSIRLHPSGKVIEDWWADINLEGRDTGTPRDYPTQKPVALLERIVRASRNEGGLVADPFCGSGTALVAAKRLARRWFGCDLNAEAVCRDGAAVGGGLTAPLAGLAV